MTLEEATRNAMVDAVDTVIGATGRIDFYTAAGDLPTSGGAGTGMLHAATQLACSADAMQDAVTGVGTFNDIATDTVDNDGTVAFFALKQATDSTSGDVVLTGSVAVSGADITFNTVDWDQGDNVSITSLTFTQPAS